MLIFAEVLDDVSISSLTTLSVGVNIWKHDILVFRISVIVVKLVSCFSLYFMIGGVVIEGCKTK